MTENAQTFTDHIDTIRDALLRSSASMRSLLIAEALPVRFRQDTSTCVELCENGIEALKALTATRQIADLINAFDEREESSESEDTMILQAVQSREQ